MGNRGKMGKKDKTLEKEENRVRGGKCRKNGGKMGKMRKSEGW